LGASGQADILFFILNSFVFGALIGWALLSQSQVALLTSHALGAIAGPSPIRAAGAWSAAVTSVAMLLAFEFGYWIDHWLSHNVPALWEIHKVHHTAEALSPLTNFRVHPLESLKFYNITAITTGLAAGLLDYGLGAGHGRLLILGVDALFLVFMFSFAHLLHSHVWISLRGPLGRVLMSPASHQIHHSADPRDFGCNLGNALAIWDWMFGTLRLPAQRREALTFGVSGEGAAAHTARGSLLTPMFKAAEALVRPQPIPTRSAARPSPQS
jgi:sterol desaturase/sphingolipid hydroxylase (fatty acid hydroxylase superfamily)